MKKKLGYFIASVVVLTAAFLVLAQGQGRRDARLADEGRAISVARSLAWTVAESYERDDTDDLAQSFADRAMTSVPGLAKALVLKGTKFVVHTDKARAGQRLDRESLADKVLYDAAARLKATTRKNDEERERNPSMTRDAYLEFELTKKLDQITVLMPVKVEGDFKAMATIVIQSDPPSTGLPLGVVITVVLGVLLFGLLAWKLDGYALFGAGSILVILIVISHANALIDWRDGVRRNNAAIEAKTIANVMKAGMFDGASVDGRKKAIHELDRTTQGLLADRLLEVRSATVAGSVAGIEHEVEGTVATYNGSWFEGQRKRDVRGLTEWSIGFGLIALLLFNLGLAGHLLRGYKSLVAHRSAYAYMAPAGVGMMVLVFIPVVYGIVLGFMQREYNEFQFSGLANYIAILSDFNFTHPQNFYFTLGVTVLWTFTNVTLHVSIGLFFALMLNDQMLKARGIFRVVLVIPWAVPNYITALIWKGMFHRQFGVINHVLGVIGIEPVSWFQTFWPSFSTNLITNTWLGFPFMMVVSLGALQSIPTDLYEAAIVDGASRWQRFRHITLPLLMPALVPAVIVGTVWTFNMFNIIYLVSGGAPNGATDILITEAFRWAFERDKYGYAAAYSTVIFLVLLLFTVATNKVTGATKGAFE